MSGIDVETHEQKELRLREERETRLRQFIKENRPIKAIAKLEGVDFAYATILVKKLVKKEGLEYKPPRIARAGKEEILGLTEDSQRFRGRLADRLFLLELDRRTTALEIGIQCRAQAYALNSPFNYDWSLSSIERLARKSNRSFKQLMLEALLSPEEREKIKRCGII